MTTARERRFEVSERAGDVSASWLRPRGARAVLALAHGAGAGMRHPFMEAICQQLAARRIATFRYQFPYMERGGRAPSPRPVLLDTVRAALYEADALGRGLPLFAGGKSMGGRMTSLLAADECPGALKGLVFLGFPLHPAGRPGDERGAHLKQVRLPMLFLQGTRDKLAELALLRPLCRSLGRRAKLQIVEGGDHSFHVLKRSGRTDDEAMMELADTIDVWTARIAS